MQKLFLLLGSISGIISVAIGAFGAHGLKDYLTKTGRLDTFETAVKYQFYHTFALILVALLLNKYNDKLLNYAGYSFAIGIVLFSGSLYALVATQVTKFGAITPLGGLFFIAGWTLMAWVALKA